MKVLFACLLFCTPALATTEPDWEACLDAEDYHQTLNMGFLSDGSITKKGCEFRIVDLGKNPGKFSFDVCDSDVSLLVYDAVDSTNSKRFRATSANCSVPMFGIDFDVPESDATHFENAKGRIFSLLKKAEKAKGSQTKQRLACARKLFETYLGDCSSFEAPSPSKSVTPLERKNIENLLSPVNIPGIHPQTILKQKK